jgi:hypothetical protein
MEFIREENVILEIDPLPRDNNCLYHGFSRGLFNAPMTNAMLIKCYATCLRKISVAYMRENMHSLRDMLMEEIQELPEVRSAVDPIECYLKKTQDDMDFYGGVGSIVALATIFGIDVNVWNENGRKSISVQTKNPRLSLDLILRHLHYDKVTVHKIDPNIAVRPAFVVIKVPFGNSGYYYYFHFF